MGRRRKRKRESRPPLAAAGGAISASLFGNDSSSEDEQHPPAASGGACGERAPAGDSSAPTAGAQRRPDTSVAQGAGDAGPPPPGDAGPPPPGPHTTAPPSQEVRQPEWLHQPAPESRTAALGVDARRENFRLKQRMSFGLRGGWTVPAHPTFGLYRWQVDVGLCAELLPFVTSPRCRNEHGMLMIGGLAYPGYGDYRAHEGATHRPTLQSQYTAMIRVESMARVYHDLPVLQRLAESVASELHCELRRVKCAHLLFQRQRLSVFTWHEDDHDMKMSKQMITVVISLHARAQTGMQVWGFEPFEFTGQGCAVAFAGAAQHRSIRSPQSDDLFKDIRERSQADLCSGPVKLVFFLD